MDKQGKKNHRVVLVPCPYQGHISPMFQLGTILESRGFSITVVHTIFNSPDRSIHPEFTFMSIPDGLSEHDISSGDLVALVLNLNNNCKAPFKELLDKLMRQQDEHEDIACIIYDAFMFFSETVADNLKIPSILFQTANASTLRARSAFPKLRAQGLIPLQDPMLQDLVSELQPLRFKDLPISNFGGLLEDFLQLLATICKKTRFSAMIWNTTEGLEGPVLEQLRQHYRVPLFAIGPLHKFALAPETSLITEDKSCITWLDKQIHESVLYVSMGSVVSITVEQLVEMAWGLAHSKQPFLWVIRPGSISGSEWIELLPEGFQEHVEQRGCIVQWAPQKDVLAHKAVGGFWSHCGWNSTVESICEGVPMICQPCFGDQKVNARYLSHVWKVGLHLENIIERGNIQTAIQTVMVDEIGDELRRNAMALKEEVQLCINEEGGSSHRSLSELVDHILSFPYQRL